MRGPNYLYRGSSRLFKYKHLSNISGSHMPFKNLRNKFASRKHILPSTQISHGNERTEAMGYDFTVYKGGKDGVVKLSSHKDDLKDDEVYLQVTHSGICGTDRLYRGAAMVLGHEGVGIVKEIGPKVKLLKV